MLYRIGTPVFVRKSSGSSETLPALVQSHTEDPNTPTTITGVVVEYEGERKTERILFETNRLIPFKKEPSIVSFGTETNISEKRVGSRDDLRNFRQNYSQFHTDVVPPVIAQGYCKDRLNFETFTATKLELCVRLDLRTKEEGYLDSKIDLRTY